MPEKLPDRLVVLPALALIRVVVALVTCKVPVP